MPTGRNADLEYGRRNYSCSYLKLNNLDEDVKLRRSSRIGPPP